MKNTHFLSIFLWCCFSWPTLYAQDLKPNVVITGILKNFDNQSELEDMSDIGRISLPNPRYIFLPDSNGRFEVLLSLVQPNYFRIGRNILYLSPGDSLYAVIDFNRPEKAEFKGKGSVANDFLRYTPFPKAGSYASIDSLIKPTVEECITSFVAYGKRREQQLLSLENVLPEFVRLEKARIKADIINSIRGLNWYFPEAHRMSAESARAFQEGYWKRIENLIQPFAENFAEADYLKLVVYQQIAPYVIEQNASDSTNAEWQQIKDWLAASSIFKDLTLPDATSDIKTLRGPIDSLKTYAYKQCLLKVWQSRMDYGVGDLATDFIAHDTSGAQLRLSDMRGKIILLDFWATWCGPCIQAFPHIQTIREHFKTDTNVVVISVSIDEDKAKWKRAVDKYKLPNPCWLIDRADLARYQLLGIPRIIIIDPQFIIKSFSGLEARQQEEIFQLIEGLKHG